MKKTLNIFIALCFILQSSLAFASGKDAVYVIDDFSKGMNSHISIFKTPKNQAHELTNVRINRSYSALSKREAMISILDFGSTAINSIHRFYKSDATMKTVVATSTLLRADFSGTATTIADGLTDGKKWQFVTYQDVEIGGNESDQPLKYDGHTQVTANTDGSRVATELCAELGAPFAELSDNSDGNDLIDGLWYMYKMSWYDGTTYSYSTARSNPLQAGTAATVIEDCEDAWTTAQGGNVTCTADTENIRGTNSAKMASIADLGADATLATEDFASSADLSAYDKIHFRIRCSETQTAGDLEIGISEDAAMGGTPVWVSIPAIAAADTWYGFSVAITLTGKTSVDSVGIRQHTDEDGITNIYIDDVRVSTGAIVGNIYLTDIPIGPSGTTNRYIYRTRGGADQATVEADTTYYMIKDLSDNSTLVFEDTIAEQQEPNSPTWATVSDSDALNVTPPICAIWEIINERAFASGNTTYKSRIYWSDEYNPDYFDPTDNEDIRPDDGDEVTFIKPQLGIPTIGKTNTVQRFYTDASSDSDWYASDPYSHEGCPAPYTATNTPIGIFYLNWFGLWNYNGQNAQLVSDAVTDIIRDISPTDMETAVGYYHDNKYYLAYTSSTSGSAGNDRVLIYDLIRDAYVLDTKNISCFVAFKSGTDIGTLYSGSSTTDGYVVAHAGTSSLLGVRYKSDFADGTHDDTMTYATEYNPIISMESLDRMEDYQTDALAQASWVTSETTEKIPPDIGDGSDGSKTVSSNEALEAGTYNYTTLTIDSGFTLTTSGSVIIKVLDAVAINGTLTISTGLCSVYATSITVGAAGAVDGNAYLRANTITVTTGGTLSNTISPSNGSFSLSGGGGSLSGSCTSQEYPFANSVTLTSITYSLSASANTDDYSSAPWTGVGCTVSVYYDGSGWSTLYNSSDSGGTSSSTSLSGTQTTGWNNVLGIKAYSNATAVADHNTAVSGSTSISAVAEIVCDYINSSGTVPTSGSTSDFENALECYSVSGDVNVNEGDYALKIVCAEGSITLNEYLENAITSIDLSNSTHDTILIDVKANRAGTNFQLGIDETGGDYSGTGKLQNVVVATADAWETIELDFSSVTDAAKDAIVLLALKFTNTDDTNILYIDNIRPGLTSGNWTSPVYQIDAEDLDKLYWNEELGSDGDITFQIRLHNATKVSGTVSSVSDNAGEAVFNCAANHGLEVGDTVTLAGFTTRTSYNHSGTVAVLTDSDSFETGQNYDTSTDTGTWGITWNTAVSSPSGSDISSITADDYIQIRANFSTTNSYYAPYLYQADGYVFRLIYSKVGDFYETTVPSVWRSGFTDFEVPGYKKFIKRIKIYYHGTLGVLTFNMKGDDDAKMDKSFTVDLSIEPNEEQFYTGLGDAKVFTWHAPPNTEENPSPISELWRFTISEDGLVGWDIDRCQILYTPEEIYD